MRTFRNLENIQDSIDKLKTHLEDAEQLISYLEEDLDADGAYQFVETAMHDIKVTYDELLQCVETLDSDIDDIVNEDEDDE